ncbi:hypothetical protein BC826DRAFT_64784 [Russula brevipes]|nr:hypothetical protein BC826DRAFT_64784 [Russula brevipes]
MPSAVPSLCSSLLVVFRLIGTLNQFFIPRNQSSQSHSYQLRFFAQLHTSLTSKSVILPAYTFHTCHDLYTPTLLFAKAHSFFSLFRTREIFFPFTPVVLGFCPVYTVLFFLLSLYYVPLSLFTN